MRNEKYKLSVIIPTYNRSKLLEYTLNSLKTQNVESAIFEVIVCDDGSSDNTFEIVTLFQDCFNLKYVFQEDKGFRPASMRNKGIQSSEGNICLFIDSGVILERTCLKQHLDFYLKHSNNACAIGYVYGFDQDCYPQGYLANIIDPMNTELIIEKLQLNEKFHDIREVSYIRFNDEIENLAAPWFYFWTCHVSVLKSNLFEVGFFDEKYDGNWGVEDADLGFRLHKKGVKIYLLRKAKSIHFPHEQNKLKKICEGKLNSIYFHKKYNCIETEIFKSFFDDPNYVDIHDYIPSST